MIYLFALPGLIAFGAIANWISKSPVRGLYIAFFATGILETVSLGPLREKLGLTELAIVLTWFAMLLGSNWRRERNHLTQLQKLSFIFLAAFVLAEWVSFFVNNATFYDRMIGSLVEVFNYTYGAMMVATVVLLVNDFDKLKNCLFGWMLGALVVGLVAIWAMTGGAPSWTMDEFTGRVSSTLKFENQIPSFIIPILLPTIVLVLSRNMSSLFRIGLSLLAGLMAVTMISTGSRTAFLLLILSFVVLFIIGFIERKNTALFKGRLGLFIIIIGVSLCGYVVSVLAAFDGHYQLGKTPAWQRPVAALINGMSNNKDFDTTRENQLKIVVDNMDQSMFIGNGPKLYGAKYRMEEIHNTYAGVYFEAGLLGLGSFLLFLLFSLYSAHRSRKLTSNDFHKLIISSLVAGFFLLLLYGGTMYGLRQRNIWLMAGLLISLHGICIKERQNN
ncbi:O-antigen ligase family protein [Vibrio sp. 1863]|uniref:O-antigen ligase family protein n=1 Tax=Vibrio sp. 1863 TaxID=3074579 RepID=UPI0029648793|nr:O-antigen ligase family protein [Vibrio sp. 1863]MDW2075369.1 O-antigen ligase family protein [Vibrio sp. 1863]